MTGLNNYTFCASSTLRKGNPVIWQYKHAVLFFLQHWLRAGSLMSLWYLLEWNHGNQLYNCCSSKVYAIPTNGCSTRSVPYWNWRYPHGIGHLLRYWEGQAAQALPVAHPPVLSVPPHQPPTCTKCRDSPAMVFNSSVQNYIIIFCWYIIVFWQRTLTNTTLKKNAILSWTSRSKFSCWKSCHPGISANLDLLQALAHRYEDIHPLPVASMWAHGLSGGLCSLPQESCEQET